MVSSVSPVASEIRCRWKALGGWLPVICGKDQDSSGMPSCGPAQLRLEAPACQQVSPQEGCGGCAPKAWRGQIAARTAHPRIINTLTRTCARGAAATIFDQTIEIMAVPCACGDGRPGPPWIDPGFCLWRIACVQLGRMPRVYAIHPLRVIAI